MTTVKNIEKIKKLYKELRKNLPHLTALAEVKRTHHEILAELGQVEAAKVLGGLEKESTTIKAAKTKKTKAKSKSTKTTKKIKNENEARPKLGL